MKITKWSLSILLVFAIIFSAVGIGFDTVPLANISVAAAEGVGKVAASHPITFYVPELIYLAPSAGNATVFRYFVDSDTNGVLNTDKAKTAGVVYFHCESATTVSISASGAAVTLGATTGTKTVNTTVTAGNMTTGVAQGNTATITWTATYIVDGKTMTAKAYSVAYAPQVRAVGVVLRMNNSDGSGQQDQPQMQALSYISGIHGVSSGATDRNFRLESGGGEVNGMCPMLGDVRNPNGENWHAPHFTESAPAGTGWVRLHEWSGGDNDRNEVRVSPTATLTVDTSRYSLINQIPNLTCGFMFTHLANTRDGARWYMTNYNNINQTEFTHWIDSFTERSSDSSGNRNTWWHGEQNGSAAGRMFAGADVDMNPKTTGIMYGGTTGGAMWSQSITGTGVDNIRLKAAGFSRADNERNAGIMFTNVDVNKVNKTALRVALRESVNYGLQVTDHTPVSWNAFETALKAAAESLGDPTAAPITTATLINARNNLVPTQYTATITHVGTDSKFSVNDPVLTFNSGDTVTATANTYPGYTLSASTPSPQTWINQRANVTHTFQYTPNTYMVTFDPQGGEVSTPMSQVVFNSTYGQGSGGWPTPTRTGYVFDGWYSGAGGTGTLLQSATTVSTPSDHTIYAKWNPATYYVTYDPNGSSWAGSTPNSTHQYGVASPLTTNGFTRPGYIFNGWSTSSTGGVQYTDGDQVSALTTVNGATVTLYAVWTGNTYFVAYNGNGATGGTMANTTFIYGSSGPLRTNAFTRAGYSFAGWATSAGGPVVYADGQSVLNLATSGTVTLFARWTANTYTVVYDGNQNTGGSTPISTHIYDIQSALASNGFTRTGHTFLGWSTSSTATVPEYTNGQTILNLTTEPDTAVVFYAIWQAHQYTITFNANGGEGGEVQTVSHGDIPVPPEVTRDGYTFVGWTPDIVEATQSTAYTAQWDEILPTTYQITFDANGGEGSEVQTVNEGTVPIPPEVTRDGYTFIGWTPDIVSAAEDATYTAQWEEIIVITHQITFDANGGDGGEVQMVEEGTIPVPPTVTREGYTFAGWTPEVVEATTDATYTAVWTINTYQITFDADGGEGGVVQTVDYGTVPTPPDVIREGYIFLGWIPDIVAATEDATYTAQWEEIPAVTYQITFDADGGEGGEVQIVNEGTVPVPPEVTREGYTFAGWTPEVVEAAADATYYAMWTINTYQITFDANGGEGGAVQMVDYGTVPTPPEVTREGYTFAGWTPEVVAASADTTYTAEWTINTYQITFDANGGEGGAVQTIDFGTVPTPPEVTREGYAFAGWTPEVVAASADATYTAVWTINTYQITFDADGGEGGAVQTVDHGTVPTPPEVTREGFNFIGWTPDIVAAAEDTTYTAQWEEIPVATYQITFDADGGEGGEVQMVEEGAMPNPPEVTREGYSFEGWMPDLVAASEDAIYIAQWTINTYNAIFVVDGDIFATVPTVFGESIVVPAEPEKFGYDFVGWNPIPGAIGAADETFHAVWSKTPITLEAKPESAAIVDNETGFIYGLPEGTTLKEFINGQIQVGGDGVLRITFHKDSFGTGTKVELIDRETGEVVTSYYIVIFGDVDGDGYITGSDVNLMALAAAGQDSFANGSPFEFAADLTGNGAIDHEDLNILSAATNYAGVIDQTNPSVLL